ncbi:hypothetical protein ACHAXA_006197 [Cyclostephanos tholiformis]|uniref:Uncharacterized protein n=1 Tax=Cyclostephanos tholiformis TaxID=382380 RepID=A0ABD3RRB7_9STRA
MFEERGGGGGGGCELTPLRWSGDMIPTTMSGGEEGVGDDVEVVAVAGPTLCERTPVRMDLSHSCWSDIFFLAMDRPEVARVVNLSVDLAVSTPKGGAGGGMNDVADDAREVARPVPPIECRLRLTTSNPGTIRLTSLDLNSTVLLTRASQVFDFGSDHLGLLKAGLVASGIVPLGLEGRDDVPLGDLLSVMMPTLSSSSNGGGGCPYGLELTTLVRDIPKGSRLAVSTNLLGSMIALGMRATGQTSSLIGPLLEEERRLVAARAILGEWLGGSGGGWQDSGGVWPGLKLIHGVRSTGTDPEYGVSRGRLLPRHRLLTGEDAPESLLRELGKSLVLIHGGMAQNVGPILEMVTEKYLLREEEELDARRRSVEIMDELLMAFRNSDVRTIARLVTENFLGPIRAVIPFASNVYTETLIERMQEQFGENFWGFLMCGGMSGGGMGFFFDPSVKEEARTVLESVMLDTKKEMECCLPYAMEPVIFTYSVNETGTVAELYPEDPSKDVDEVKNMAASTSINSTLQDLDTLLRDEGFDPTMQEQIRDDLLCGRIGE